MIIKLIEKYFLSSLSKINFGAIDVTTPDGKKHRFQGSNQGHECNLIINDNKFYFHLLFSLDSGFAKSYGNSLCETRDLAMLFLFVIQNSESIHELYKNNYVSRLLLKLLYRLKENTIKGSKKNILAHYDIGNDFYKQWLDPNLSYSSAIFYNKDETLEQAQNNKYKKITELIKNPYNILEIGCGWGGFIDFITSHKKCNITGLTISNEQYQYITNKFKDKPNVNLLLQDYREHIGEYDAIVSIEMIEAVGDKYWPVYFNKIKSCLSPSGVAVIQAILIDDEYFDDYRKNADFIRSMIFPGGMLLSKNTLYKLAAKSKLKITHFNTFGSSYVITLQKWLLKFNDKINEFKHDMYFLKIWQVYLCYCIAGFISERINVAQLRLEHI